jgi:CRP/FNR family transcriptional regulator, cyclic AMP receptor protein
VVAVLHLFTCKSGIASFSFGKSEAQTVHLDEVRAVNIMPLIPETAVFHKRLVALPLATYQPGETILAAGSMTGRLLFLKNGAVAVVRHGVQIDRLAEPGTVFGEIPALLGRPHTADIQALEISQFHVADADVLLAQDPVVLLRIAAALAQRLDSAYQAVIDLRKVSRWHTFPPI